MTDKSTQEKHQFMEDQTREFRDRGGHVWSARIVQGGGGPAASVDGPPVARILFQRVGSVETAWATVKDPGSWDLASYGDDDLRRLLESVRPASTSS
jgi:hypothetical protein